MTRRLALTLTLLAAATALPAQTASPEATAPRRAAPRLAIPAFGENAVIQCQTLVFESASGRLQASGGVVVRSDRFNIDCDQLDYDDQSKTMAASGQAVHVITQDINATGGALTYNTETGAISIRRAGGPQPQIVQQKPDSTLTAVADAIDIAAGDSGQTNGHFAGDVHIRNVLTNPDAERPRESALAAPQIAVNIPGMGDDGTMTCSSLVYTSATGDLTAGGGVIINTPDLFLDCQDFQYTQSTGRLIATGENVYLKKEDVESRCTRLTYLTDAGRIFLERMQPSDPQPQVWQNREDHIFHAVADQISMTEMPDQRNRVGWTGNVMVETLPRRASEEESAPLAPTPARPIQSIDDLPGAQVDPFA